MAQLADAYFQAESREWRCSECGGTAARATQRVLSPLPPSLVLHIKRFHSDASTGVTRKLRTPIRVDPTLRLSAHLEGAPEAAEVAAEGAAAGEVAAGGAGGAAAAAGVGAAGGARAPMAPRRQARR